MKAAYDMPEQEIVEFKIEDVITTSTQSGGMSNAGGGASIEDNDQVDFGDLFGKN